MLFELAVRETFLGGLAIISHTETRRKMNRRKIVKKVAFFTAWLASLAAIMCAVIGASAVMASAKGFAIADLGVLPGGQLSEANSINKYGQAVGYAVLVTNNYLPNNYRAALFSNGTVTDLGTLPGFTNSEAYNINNSGQAVGFASDVFSTSFRAALFSNGTVTDLGTLPGFTNSRAWGINDSGQAVGYVGDTSFRAALFSNGTVTDLGTLPGLTYSKAYNINNSGQAVGFASDVQGFSVRAVLFSNGTVTDLGTLPGFTGGVANSINNSSQAVGYAYNGDFSPFHAALFSNGTVTDLGTLPGFTSSVANSINNSGQAVGYASNNVAVTPVRAALFSNGTVTDLNSLVDTATGWVLLQALGINDSGQIVGNGTINGQSHAFLLTPACNFTFGSSYATTAPAGGGNSVNLSVDNTVCAWTAVSNVPWITITSGSSGTGNGTVQYSVTSNTGGVRTGTITIANQTFTVIQGTTSTHAQIGVFRSGAWYVDRDENFGWSGCGLDGCYAYGMAGDQVVAGDWDGTGIMRIGVFINGWWYLDMNGNNSWDGSDAAIPFGIAGDIPVVGNWDGSVDGKSKIGVFRNGTWYLDYSGTYAATGTWAGCGAPADPTKDACMLFGVAGDIPVVGNWDGNADGKSKIGVFRNGTWYLDYSGTYAVTGIWAGCGAPTDPTKTACIPYGVGSDIPVVGDWDGSADGKSKIGVFRNGTWYLDYSGTYAATGIWAGCGAPTDPTKEVCTNWGIPGDIPVVLR